MRLNIVALVLGLSILYVAPIVPAQSAAGGFVCIDDEYDCWRGVPGADVELFQSGLVLDVSHETTTDAEGYFEFDGVDDGEYTLTITRAGFELYEATVQYPFEKQQFPLQPEAVTVSGHVVDEAGAGIADASISSWSERGRAEATSAEDGSFTLELEAGYRQFEIVAKEFLRSSEEVFVDGSDVEFTLVEAPPTDATVSGIIADQHGDPVAGVEVNAYQWGYYDDGADKYYEYDYEGRNMRVVSDEDGAYSIEARAGEISLSFWKDGYASANVWFELASGEDKVHDVLLNKYPDKTAKIEGRLFDADTGAALRFANINFNSVEFGLWSCSQYESDDRGEPEPVYAESPEGSSMIAEPYPYYERDCDITLHDDGTFTGMVTPGYSTVNIWFDHYRTCVESSSSDGSYSRTCGQDYFGWVGTFDLEENSTTAMNIGLEPKPKANSIVQGYAVDAETGKAIPGARFSFSNQDGYAWGDASTDQDGSYKVRIRGGYQHVNVWAEGYFPWQGVLQVEPDGTTNFDVKLTAGQTQYGGHCCYAYSDDVAYAEASPGGPRAVPAQEAPSDDGDVAFAGGQSADSGDSGDSDFEDLQGGLGPYDAQKREQELQSGGKESPGLPMLALLGAVAGLVWLQRRK